MFQDSESAIKCFLHLPYFCLAGWGPDRNGKFRIFLIFFDGFSYFTHYQVFTLIYLQLICSLPLAARIYHKGHNHHGKYGQLFS